MTFTFDLINTDLSYADLSYMDLSYAVIFSAHDIALFKELL